MRPAYRPMRAHNPCIHSTLHLQRSCRRGPGGVQPPTGCAGVPARPLPPVRGIPVVSPAARGGLSPVGGSLRSRRRNEWKPVRRWCPAVIPRGSLGTRITPGRARSFRSQVFALGFGSASAPLRRPPVSRGFGCSRSLARTDGRLLLVSAVFRAPLGADAPPRSPRAACGPRLSPSRVRPGSSAPDAHALPFGRACSRSRSANAGPSPSTVGSRPIPVRGAAVLGRDEFMKVRHG